MARRTRSSVTMRVMLSDDALAHIFTFLDAMDLLSTVRTCRAFNLLVAARPAVCEAALFDADPFAVVGPSGVAAALHLGLSILDVVRRLGDTHCSQCRAPGAIIFDRTSFRRFCNHESCPLPPDCMRALLFNRFCFFPQHAPGVLAVSSERELRAAIGSATTTAPNFRSTIVVTQSLELSDQLMICWAKLCGARGQRVKLTCLTGPVVVTCGMVHLEDLELVSGDAAGLCGDCGVYHDGNFPAVEVIHGEMLLRNVRIHGVQGSAVMNDGGSVSLDSCDIRSDEFIGVINKSADDPSADSHSVAAVVVATSAPAATDHSFFMSSRGCTFSGSLWHISAGADISEADEGALVAANCFRPGSCLAFPDEPVTRHLSEHAGGRIQPWRPGCLHRTSSST